MCGLLVNDFMHPCGYLAVAGLFEYFLVVSLYRFHKRQKDRFVTDYYCISLFYCCLFIFDIVAKIAALTT